MREIKFRMWDDEEKTMIDGDSLAFEEYLPIKDLLSQDSIMQFTGLHDKNGKEIYEGDICNCPETGVDGTIVFHNGRFTWTDGACHWDMVLNSKDGQPRDSVIPEADDLVIIGNIHETPSAKESQE